MINFDEEKQIKKLESLRQTEEEDLARLLSEKYGVAYTDLVALPINTDALKLIKEDEARANKIAVFDILGKKIKVAVLSPNNTDTQESIERLKKAGFEISVYMVSNASLEKAWSRYADISYSVKAEEGLLSITGEVIESLMDETRSLDEVKQALDNTLKVEKTNKVSKFFDVILAGALSIEASDIHIEAEENSARVRFRLDGVLTNIYEFDKRTYELILSRVKLISGLKLNIKENSQDGRFSIKMGEAEIEIRTSTIPGNYGESVVLRILNPESIGVPMEELGIEENLLNTLLREIKKPNGMLLNTGPTGSGKTTTLYAFLKKVHTPEIKIITIEDPVEYHLSGITQTQVEKEKGYTFAQGLRSALRQDPDVIMVGEIRDNETAEIAINSALTGHLVLSTLHTNTAAGTFPRLSDLGVDPKIIGSAVNVTMAQRLVRKLCNECKQEILLEDKDKETVDRILESIVGREKYKIDQTEKMYKAVGCDKCNFTGYKGRIGIYEAILVTEEIEEIVRQYPSEREIQKAAVNQEILNMEQDGVIKVLNGITSLEELRRVIEIDETSIQPKKETVSEETNLPE